MSMLTTITLIQGACINTLELDSFSLSSILDDDDVCNIKNARQTDCDDDASDITVTESGSNTIVSLFNSDGEVMFYIGRTDDFIGPRDIE